MELKWKLVDDGFVAMHKSLHIDIKRLDAEGESGYFVGVILRGSDHNDDLTLRWQQFDNLKDAAFDASEFARRFERLADRYSNTDVVTVSSKQLLFPFVLV